MKKIFLITILLLSVFFSGCSSATTGTATESDGTLSDSEDTPANGSTSIPELGSEISSDFNSSTNYMETFHGIEFQVPIIWEKKKSNEIDTLTYYLEDGLFMITHSICEYADLRFSTVQDDIIFSSLDEFSDWEVTNRAVVSVCQKDAFTFSYTCTIDEKNCTGNYTTFFLDGTNLITFVLMDYGIYDHLSDVANVIDSIKEVSILPSTSETPDTNTDSENDTPESNDENNVPSNASITMGQKNALKSAKSYLDYSGFSYSGLIDQLEYEGYTTEEATYAADNCGADWNEQAARTAQSYLDYSSFSRSSLIEQLEYEGFTPEQAEYGVTAVGY